MTNPVYNVIWVDDEIDQILEEARESFELQDVRIVGTAKSALELQEKLKILKGKYDAVITDANFSMHLNAPMEERDYSGLMCLLGLLAMYKDIPFFIYTGRPLGNLYEQFKYGELEYFRSQEHVFIKGKDESALIEKIKERVDKCQSIEHIIRNKYNDVLYIFPKIESEVFEILKVLENNDKTCTTVYNSTRKILEFLARTFFERGLTAVAFTGTNIAECSRDLGSKELCLFVPKYIQQSFMLCCILTNEGSHKTNFSERIRIGEAPYANMSVINCLLNILQWCKNLPSEENAEDMREIIAQHRQEYRRQNPQSNKEIQQESICSVCANFQKKS